MHPLATICPANKHTHTKATLRLLLLGGSLLGGRLFGRGLLDSLFLGGGCRRLLLGGGCRFLGSRLFGRSLLGRDLFLGCNL